VATYSDSGPGWDAYGGVKPVVWQYTDGLAKYAGGGLHHADTNAFKGTEAQLAVLFNGATEDQDMAMTTDDVHTFVTAASLPADTPTMSLGTVVMDAQAKARAAAAGVAALAPKVDQILAALGQPPVATVDVAALAAALAPLLNADDQTATEATLKDALSAVLNETHLVVTP
jgi:hypothetical protein